MLPKRDAWLTQIKAVEREHSTTRLATDRLLEAARRDPTVLRRILEPRDISEASANLEATYLIRLFAVFESGLRQFWQAVRPHRRPRTEHLLDGVASARGIPSELLVNAHAVRAYRNTLVHEQAEDVHSLTITAARRYLCQFFSRLPPEWGT
jgi:hypothetical protein